ncbi:hypothetical protein [Stenotrophomonas sp.]|uniref:hypothetical protein n=1 Tax=Stenotrophomonas sp. TaxID=69392 RepID=UPI0028A887DB|nr:hypothetical protein [Stenotrophomonas sp.]
MASNPTHDREVFPVGLRANHVDVWLAWESPGSGADYFWATEEGILHADSLSVMLEEIHRVDGGVKVGIDAYFDVDGALRCLREHAAVDPELMIDIWNLLTDLSRTHSGRGEFFRADLSDTYDAYFSRCEVAEFVGLEEGEISAEDLENAGKVLKDGIALIEAAIQLR